MKSLLKMSNPHPGQTVQSLSPPHKKSAAVNKSDMLYDESGQGYNQGRNVNSQTGKYLSNNELLLLEHNRRK